LACTMLSFPQLFCLSNPFYLPAFFLWLPLKQFSSSLNSICVFSSD
jgi:hypothetical protein